MRNLVKLLALTFATLLLGSCDKDSLSDPLSTDVTFTAPNPLQGPGTATVKLQVRNNTQKTIANIAAEVTFPADVSIEGGSVGSLCGAVTYGDAGGTGYQFGLSALGPGEECGVFMDIYPTTIGDKTFTVEAGKITANDTKPNAQFYSWIWNGGS